MQSKSLTLLRDAVERNGEGRIRSLFLCHCGTEFLAFRCRVKTGLVKDCGCVGRENIRRASTVHGMRGTPTYTSWSAMKRRCLVPTDKDYASYGGRGITVCDDWITSFEMFFEHVGVRPQGTTLDRIDVMGNYEPGNVRWATRSQQQNNKRGSVTWVVKGKWFETIADAARYYGVSKQSVWRWVRGGTDKRRNYSFGPREDCYPVTAHGDMGQG